MSSHWDWEKNVIAEHNQQKPYAPENGQLLKFKPGTPVIYTNDHGIEFPLIVTGYYAPNNIDSHYASGARYMLSWDCYWFPTKESTLRFDPTRTILFYEVKPKYKVRPTYPRMKSILLYESPVQIWDGVNP